jgi:hypothetical protein
MFNTKWAKLDFMYKSIITLFLLFLFNGILLFTPFLKSQTANSPKPSNRTFLSNQGQKGDVQVDEQTETATDVGIDSISVDPKKLNELRNIMDDELFVMKKGERELFWPSFPRIWTERSVLEQQNLNFGTNININPFSIGLRLKRAVSNQYSLKTTFVMISSDKPTDPRKYESDGGQYPIIRTIYHTGTDKAVYANVDDNFPIVGFCSFEAKYAAEIQKSQGITILSLTGDEEEVKSEPVSYYVTSKLFQIRKKIPIKQYLHVICGKIFKEKIEPKVLQDFTQIKKESEFQMNLVDLNLKTGLCDPNVNTNGSPINENDLACDQWQKQHFHPMVAARTLARCEYDKFLKNNYCQLRSRENKTCPIYWDPKKNVYHTKLLTTPRRAVTVTAGHYEFECDSKNGYECRFNEEPKFFLNFPFWPGRGICQVMLPSSSK